MARKRKKAWELSCKFMGINSFCQAWTKSEARAIFKKEFDIARKWRLPQQWKVSRVLG